MDDLQALAERLAALEADKAAQAKASRRDTFKSKFGNLYGNDDEVTDMLMGSLEDAGGPGAVESATAEAISEYLIKPLGDYFSKMAKTLTRAVEDKVDEVMEGTIPNEGAPAAPPQIDLPEDVGAEPLMPAPGAAAPPADMGGAPPAGDMGAASAPPPDASGMPPMDATGAPPLPPDPNAMPPALSDARYKNVRPTVLSDERFKTLNIDTDDKLQALETLCSTKELSDEDLKEILFAPTKKAEAATTLSDATKKDVEPAKSKAVSMGSLNDIFNQFMDMDPETGTTLSDARKKDVAPPAPKVPEKPVDESDAIAKDLADFGLGNLNSILSRRY